MGNAFYLYIVLIQIPLCAAADVVAVPLQSAVEINCKNSTVLQIVDIKINESVTQCPRKPCKVHDSLKHDIEKHCNGNKSCMIFVDTVNNTCLSDYGYVHFSYWCTEFPLDCNFEVDICKWKSTNDDYEWIREKALTPYTDHTLGSYRGSYIYLDTSNIPKGTSSNLVSASLQSGEWCFTFWYFVYKNGFTVHLLDNETDDVIHSVSVNDGTAWVQAWINISISDTQSKSISFEGKRGQSDRYYSSYIAIDDIMVVRGRCLAGNKFSLVCNFENDECLWTATDQHFTWQRTIGLWIYSEPSTDHTLGTDRGYFIYLAAKTAPVGTSANFTFQPLQFGEWCLTFWFHMFGSDVGSLNVYLYDNIQYYHLHNISGSHEDRWLQARIDISNSETNSKSIILNGIRGRYYSSAIAIDDIMITGGRCSDYTETCSKVDEPINLKCAKDNIEFSKVTFNLDPQLKNCSAVYERIRTDFNNFCIDSLADFCTLDLHNAVREDFDCFTLNRLTLEYTCKVIETLQQLSYSSQTLTGIIAGSIGGIGLITALIVVLCLLRRHRLKSPHNGQENIVLPKISSQIPNQNVYNELQNRNIPSKSNKARPNTSTNKTNDHKYDYLDIDSHENGFKQNTAQIPKDKKIKPDPNKACQNISDDNEHGVHDPMSQDRIDRHIKRATAANIDYAILDPSETGFNRSTGNYETKTEYELAAPINLEDLQNPYIVIENGAYNSSNNMRHKETDTNLYSHAIDSVYDTTSHDVNRRQMDDYIDTYNHVFGEKTELDYDVTKRK